MDIIKPTDTRSSILNGILDKVPAVKSYKLEEVNIPDNYVLLRIFEEKNSGLIINVEKIQLLYGEVVKCGKGVTRVKEGDVVLNYQPSNTGILVFGKEIYQAVREDNAVTWISK